MTTKEQQSKYYKEWRQKNKEKLKEYQKKWHENNKEHVKEYLQENSDHIRQQQKEYRENNKEKIHENWNEWYKNHPERSPKRRFAEAKNKSIKKRQIEWNLSFDEYSLLIKKPCYYCENKLGEPVKRSTGLDRLDSSKGYELSNVVSCCYVCNCIKNEFLTPEETKAAVYVVINMRAKLLR